MVVAPPAIRDTLVHDLEAFPAPWLTFLKDYGLKVVAMGDGQTLAQSPVMAKFAVPELQQQIASVRDQLGPALAKTPVPDDELARYQQRQQLRDVVHGWLQGGPFRLATHDAPLDLEEVAERRHVPAEQRAEWKSLLQELNAPWSQLREGQLATSHGLVLLPPIPTGHGAVPDQAFQSARETTGEYVKESLGLNRAPEGLVLLHERFLPSDAPEVGPYRLALHEVGHALDYALEGLPDETGFGAQHKARLQEWFAREQTFTSDRADDNAREYFAEAVEAYLTPADNGSFRQENNREYLQKVNPELYGYLDGLFTSQPHPSWRSRPPEPPRVPEGFPDPDRDPLEL